LTIDIHLTIQAAKTAGELLALFISDSFVRKAATHTNEKILEEFDSKKYSARRLKKSPYIKETDEASS
jgi:hypothetical protein